MYLIWEIIGLINIRTNSFIIHGNSKKVLNISHFLVTHEGGGVTPIGVRVYMCLWEFRVMTHNQGNILKISTHNQGKILKFQLEVSLYQGNSKVTIFVSLS